MTREELVKAFTGAIDVGISAMQDIDYRTNPIMVKYGNKLFRDIANFIPTQVDDALIDFVFQAQGAILDAINYQDWFNKYKTFVSKGGAEWIARLGDNVIKAKDAIKESATKYSQKQNERKEAYRSSDKYLNWIAQALQTGDLGSMEIVNRSLKANGIHPKIEKYLSPSSKDFNQSVFTPATARSFVRDYKKGALNEGQ